MLQILGFTLLFPAICLLVVAAAGGFIMLRDSEALPIAIAIAYALGTAPGAIAAIADYLLAKRAVPFRSLYAALVAAVVTPIVAMSIYPGASNAFWSNALEFAAIGATSAIICSLIVSAVRIRTKPNA